MADFDAESVATTYSSSSILVVATNNDRRCSHSSSIFSAASSSSPRNNPQKDNNRAIIESIPIPVPSQPSTTCESNNNNNKNEVKTQHRRFFEWAAEQLGIRELDDWYRFTVDDLAKLGGAGLLGAHYNSSLQRALASVYPDHEWLPWRFHRGAIVPAGFWCDKDNNSMANQRRFFDWVGRQLGVQQVPDDWYKIKLEDIRKLNVGGGLISRHHNNSLYQALAAVYPEHEWLPWRFTKAPAGFWKDKSNQRWFLDWAAKQLGIDTADADADNNNSSSSKPNKLDGWYAVSNDQVYALGGRSLVRYHYGGSLVRTLAAVYPEHQWDPWRFERCSPLGKEEFADEPALRRFVEEKLAPELHVEKLDDWYRVSLRWARNAISGYRAIVERYGGLPAVLRRLYPHHEWDERRLRSSDKKSSQRTLKLMTQRLFPGKEVLEEYAHQGLRYSHHPKSNNNNNSSSNSSSTTTTTTTTIEDLFAASIAAARQDLLESQPGLAEAAARANGVAMMVSSSSSSSSPSKTTTTTTTTKTRRRRRSCNSSS